MRSERPASQPVSYRKRAHCLSFQNMVSLKIEQNDCEKRILPTKTTKPPIFEISGSGQIPAPTHTGTPNLLLSYSPTPILILLL